MASVSISNPVAQNLDAVDFTGTFKGSEHRFRVHRDGLEDLGYLELETIDAMLQAFERHRRHIADVASKALDDGLAVPGKTVVLQSLLV